MLLDETRRWFLTYLCASPLLRGQQAAAAEAIANPQQALNVLDFEAAAQKALPPAHWGYLATGVDDDANLRANRSGFSRFYIRPRRLVDIRKVDAHIELFGARWESPIAFAPIGNTMAFHDEAETAVAKAARAKNVVQVLSTYANRSVADVAAARGGPVWFQLYPQSQWALTEMLVRRAEEAGCPAIAVTVDTQAGRHTETAERFRRLDTRDCTACHGTTRGAFLARKPMFAGADVSGASGGDQSLSWKTIARIRQLTRVKLLLKGIETAEDARLAIDAGFDAVVVSNHGGRAGDTGRGTIEALPEVIEAVNSRIPVLIDGGFRRGSDVFKAIALGARGVLIGRPYVWGLAAFGQPGVERVIDLLRAEFELVMKQSGVTSVAQINSAYVGRSSG